MLNLETLTPWSDNLDQINLSVQKYRDYSTYGPNGVTQGTVPYLEINLLVGANLHA